MSISNYRQTNGKQIEFCAWVMDVKMYTLYMDMDVC